MPKCKITWCHTCSKREHRLIEVTFFEGLKHRLKKHWVRRGLFAD